MTRLLLSPDNGPPGPRDVMIDIETLSVRPDAAIVSIGAVVFDPNPGVYGEPMIGEPSHWILDLSDSIRTGGRVDGDTVLWWLMQSDAARQAITSGSQVSTVEALLQLSKFLQLVAPLDHLRVWANGADFDLPILASAYARLGMLAPWRYHNTRCFRTLRKLHPEVPAPAFDGVPHHAGHDALHQARHAVAILQHLAAQRQPLSRPELQSAEAVR